MPEPGEPARRRAPRWRVRLAGFVTFLLVVPLGLVAAAAVLVEPDRFKPALQDAVLEATGRHLQIAGPMRWTPSLRPVIEADWVTLENLPGGTRPEMARVERVAVTLSLPALLRRRVQVERLVLTGPDILFELVGSQPNWRLDLPTPRPARGDGTAGGGITLDVRRAEVRNGMVTWRLPKRSWVVGIRTMEVEHDSDGGPVEFGGTFVYGDNQPFRLTGSALPTAGLADPWNTRLDLSAFDTEANATGTMDTGGGYDLQLEARAGALEKLNALLPSMQLPPVHGLTLSARLGNGRQNGDMPVVGAARVAFASADLRDRVPGLVLGATTATVDKPGGTLTLNGAGTYAGQGFTLTGTTGMPEHPDDRVAVPLDLQARSVPGQAEFTLGVKGRATLQALAYQGLDATLSLATPALAALRPLLSPSLPALTGVRFAGHLVLTARPDGVTFDRMTLGSGQGDLAGEGRLGLGRGLELSGRFRSTSLDGDAMLAAFGIDPSAPAANGGHVIPDAPLPWAVLRGPALDVTVDAARLRLFGEDWRGVGVEVRLKGGRLERGALSLASAGGPIGAVLAADASAPDLPASLAVDAPALPLSLVARYAALPGRVDGTARVVARLQGAGASLHAMASGLDGTVSLATVGGRMSNAAFSTLTGPSLGALGIKVPAGGDTAIRCLGVAARFSNGMGTISPIALETSLLSLAGEGQVDLRAERLRLDLKPLAVVSGSRIEVPVVVEGPFRTLSGRLDANLFDKLGLVIDSWFGSDTPTACVDAGLVAVP